MSEPLLSARRTNAEVWLTDIRTRAANAITDYICKWDAEADPADVHEDVREDLAPFFEEIRERVEGPTCQSDVRIGKSLYARCWMLDGHAGEHQPCVGTKVAS